MITSSTKTSYFAASNASHHSVSRIAPMEFSPLPVFFEPTLSSAAKDGQDTGISLIYSSAKPNAGSKSAGRNGIK